MTTARSYRAAMSRDEARRELRQNRGTQFDPTVVDVILAVMTEE
jgi:HD-GYP domain-containing protein (c-di-GMP phosphodiesterase class II)